MSWIDRIFGKKAKEKQCAIDSVMVSDTVEEEVDVWVDGMNEDYLDIRNPNIRLAGAREAMKRSSLEMIQMYLPDYTVEKYNKERVRLGLKDY